jgi:uncharacterized protein (TIGR02265 family)
MPTQYTAQNSLFEGLYLRTLQPQGEFQDALRAAGYDPMRPEPEYPIEVWVRCLDFRWRHLYGSLGRYAAWERLGEKLIGGFLDTLAGRVLGTALPFLSPALLLNRTPRFIKLGLREVDVHLVWRSPKDVGVLMTGPHEGAGRVLAGNGRMLLRRFGIAPVVEVAERGIDSELQFRWE